MAENAQETIWLTQEAYDKLAEELTHLKTEGRPAISAKIASARSEGDLSENGGYHAAREEQGHMESRIKQLEHMLHHAEVGEAPSNPDAVGPGMQVRVAFFGDPDDTETFLIGSREMLGLDAAVDTQVYSPQSPLGGALLGAREGDTVSYLAPNGRSIEVTVIGIQAFTG